MSKRKLIGITLIPILLLVGLLVVQLTVKSKLSNVLGNQLPGHIHLKYDELSVNVLMGSVSLNKVKLELYSPDTLLMHTSMELESLNVSGIGYFNLFFKKEVAIRHLELFKPDISHFPSQFIPSKRTDETEEVTWDHKLTIDSFTIREGQYVQMNDNLEIRKLEVASFDLSLNHVVISAETLTNKIPFGYEDMELRSSTVFVDLGPYETLNIATLDLGENELLLKEVSLKSKYNKKELSRVLTKERDHVDLKIPEILFSDLKFGFNSAQFFLQISQGAVSGPNLKIYRDKLVNDDLDHKKLYSRMLRELPFNLDLASLQIKDGYISYAEQVAEDVKPGEIVFTDLNADIKEITNTNEKGGGTSIVISTLFMDSAPLHLDWSFDVQKENDAFLVTGKLQDFNSESINPFLKSNLRAEANGMVNELFFTFSGDAVSSSGEIKMKYQDFGFVVLQKNRRGVNKLLTAFGNIFTSDGSRADPQGYRYGTIYAERDTSKSFFNYLWLNIKEGVLSTLTGNGKKE
ncbi:hypothetical protein [Arenibacter certesii]|uniref:DUF748 domain-containing protein n=1 Tax=Arenibacter certesii TaxID=228955 RepID=A0A918IVW1_9FLAO|nr:hypothetical protein [Arenibacter certesii]GGW34568.1 hypothetical protein GCM10007383_19490 [Arenibacter certesii]